VAEVSFLTFYQKKIYKKRERKKVGKDLVCVYIYLHAHIPTQIPMEWSGCSQFHLLRNLFLVLSLKRPVLLRGEKEGKERVCKVLFLFLFLLLWEKNLFLLHNKSQVFIVKEIVTVTIIVVVIILIW